MKLKLKKGYALVLRTCNADMTSYDGFKWPESGTVVAPDWDSEPECGNGLHGLLRGCGNGELLNWNEDAKWLAVSVKEDTVVDLNGKVKFPKAEVLAVGTRAEIIDIFAVQYPDTRQEMVLGQATASGNRGQATASGDRGQATASGYLGQATASGDLGQATAGALGIISLRYWDAAALRYRIKTGYIGEDGLLPNVTYRLSDQYQFEPVEKNTDAA